MESDSYDEFAGDSIDVAPVAYWRLTRASVLSQRADSISGARRRLRVP